MKPFLLMDKSSVHGIGSAHFELINQYYSHVISPILLRELVSDLAKQDKKHSEEGMRGIVSGLSARTDSPFSFFLSDAFKMACNNLLGVFVPMDGRIPLGNGIQVNHEKFGKGVFFDEPPEAQLLRRWAQGAFTPEDLKRAKEIRDADSSVNLESLCLAASNDLAGLPKFKSLKEMIDWAGKMHFSPENPAQLVLNTIHHLLPSEVAKRAIFYWKRRGCPELRKFAPYALHFYKVDMIHFLSAYYGFTRKGKGAKAHLDAQYLYYLPFCYVFTTGDDDLLTLAPFFLRDNQEYISQSDFQKDLKGLAAYFSGLTEEEKSAHQWFGRFPPDLPNSFTSRIWKKFMRPQSPQSGTEKLDPEEEKKVLQIMKSIKEAVEKKQQNQSPSQNPDSL